MADPDFSELDAQLDGQPFPATFNERFNANPSGFAAGFRPSTNIEDDRSGAFRDHGVVKGNREDRDTFAVRPQRFAGTDAAQQESPQDAITRAARESGIDPAFALAVAQRESNFDPNAHASKSIYGLFQMRGDLRSAYGAGDSRDPYTQAKAWTGFIGDQKAQMASALGRAPTNDELYFAHHFGTDRAIHMIGGMSPDTDVRDVFSPNERSLNPHFDQAGTTGQLMASISADMAKRQARFGGVGGGAGGPDFASFGVDDRSGGNVLTNKATSPDTAVTRLAASQPQAIDFAAFGDTPAGIVSPAVSGEQPAESAEEQPGQPAPSAVASAEPVYGMSAPEAQAMASNPGYRAMQNARMRGGRPGQEVDLSFLKAPGANLQNPAVSGQLPQNPALGMG